MMEIVHYACERLIFVSITINKCGCFVHNHIILMLYSQLVNLVSSHSLIESFALCCYLSFQVNMLRERNTSYGTIKFVDIGSDDYSPDENQGLDYQTVSPFSMASKLIYLFLLSYLNYQVFVCFVHSFFMNINKCVNFI